MDQVYWKKKLEILKKIGFKKNNIIFATGFREDLIKKKLIIYLHM